MKLDFGCDPRIGRPMPIARIEALRPHDGGEPSGTGHNCDTLERPAKPTNEAVDAIELWSQRVIVVGGNFGIGRAFAHTAARRSPIVKLEWLGRKNGRRLRYVFASTRYRSTASSGRCVVVTVPDVTRSNWVSRLGDLAYCADEVWIASRTRTADARFANVKHRYARGGDVVTLRLTE